MKITLFFTLAILLVSCYKESEEDLFAPEPTTTVMKDTTGTDTTNTLISFSAVIKPLIFRRCSNRGCHTNATSPGGFAKLNTYNEINVQVNNGKLEDRALVKMNMPEPGNPPLTSQEKSDLSQWLAEGATNN